MAGDLRRLRGDRDKKKRSSLYRSCLHERVILPDYRITSLLQFIHHFYNTFTSFIHHFYIIPSAHTSLSSSVPFVHHPLPERADSGFSGCAGNASRPRNKLRPRSPFSDGKNAGNRTSPGWMVWISALCTCAHTHACRKNRACAFLEGFRVVCCLFYRFPVRNALRASQAVHARDVMVNVELSFLKLSHRCIGTRLKRWSSHNHKPRPVRRWMFGRQMPQPQCIPMFYIFVQPDL